jgi:Tfp pilus assembly protein PilX
LKRSESGQVIIVAIGILLVIAISLPALINYVDREAKWTLKATRTTRAFQLAEGAVERAHQQIILSTSSWTSLQAGTPISGLNFDVVYSDIPGGTYAMKVSSGPGTGTLTIWGVGRDSSSNEVRAVIAVYSNTASNAALYAMGGVNITSNPEVEWGPVISPASIITDKLYPRYYSQGRVGPATAAAPFDTNGPTPPNTDNIQWWDYHSNLPPPPQIDTQAYLATATSEGHVYAGGTYTLGSVNGTYYFTGDTVLKPSSFVTGNIVVMGNLSIQGNTGNGAYGATMPSAAWREYGNSWAYYRSEYDGSAPGTFPGQTGTYTPGSVTYNINKVFCRGFLYVLNQFSITGGGNATVHGSMYIGNYSDLSGSNVTVYYDDTLTIKTKNLSLSRASWQEMHCRWNSTYPTCP